jgi:lambda repressor-like predicted transcriptional regulator
MHTTNKPYSINSAISANTMDIDPKVIIAGQFKNEKIAMIKFSLFMLF